MAILEWQHKGSKREVQNVILAELRREGYEDKVTWKGYRGSVSIPFIISCSFDITDTAIVLERFSGIASGAALRKCRTMLEHLFPGGEEVLRSTSMRTMSSCS